MHHFNRECIQPQKKEILRDWLMKNLNSRAIPGLTWVDKERLTFKIPWKHRGKQDWSENNGMIFKAWAHHTGKVTGGLEDYAKWKTRLRCALHKAEGIIQEKGMSVNEGDEPFRVYRFTQLKTKKKRNNTLNACSKFSTERPESRQSSQLADHFNKYEKIPTVVQCLDFEDSQECLEMGESCVDSTVEINIKDSNPIEAEPVCMFTELENDWDNGSSDTNDIIGISLEVLFKGQTILKDSFCKNERVLLKSSCHLYREDGDEIVDKIITIEEKDNSALQDILQAMAEGIHFLYAEEELFVKQATRCEVYINHFSPMETTSGIKLADEHTISFDKKSVIKFEIFQNSFHHEIVCRDDFIVLIKPITNEIN